MIMDARDTQSDLHALKRLYGVLKKDGDSTSNSATGLLDEHARVLLKNLLDAATKRVLKEHSEIVAGKISATQLQLPDESSNKQPAPLSRAAHGREKELESDKARKMDGLDNPFWKEKRLFSPQWYQAGESVLAATGLEQKKKRCRLCQRNTINLMESIKETHFYVDAQNSKRFTDDMQHQQNNEPNRDLETMSLFLSNKTDESKSETEMQMGYLNGMEFTDFSSDIGSATKRDEVDCLSMEASEAIEKIELCISALNIRPDRYLHMFEENSAQRGNCILETKSAGPGVKVQYGGVSSVDNSQVEKSLMSRSNFPSELSSQSMDPVEYPPHQVPTKTMLAQSADKFMSRGPALGSDWITSRYDCFLPSQIHNVHNYSAQLETSYRTSTWPPTFSAVSKLDGPDESCMAMEDECSKHGLFQTCKPSGYFMYTSNNKKLQSVDSGLKVSSSLKARAKNHPPNIMRRETLLDKKLPQLLDLHGNQSDAQHKSEIRKSRRYITATDSYSNSTSQQNSSLDSDSEEYSLTDQSGASPLSYGTESQSNSYTGNIEDDAYSSSSSVSDSELVSSESKGSSSYDQPVGPHARSTYSSTSKKSGPSRAWKANGKNSKKQTGMWKRMKDKMAIIFHHHHHHHHHHHDDCGKNKTKMSRNSSLLKHKGKNVNFSSQNVEAYGEKAVEKMKSAVLEKNQQSHFHGLMEGLLRHLRRSKQSKPGKETVGKLGKSQHGRQKSLKKSHWWKLLQYQRRRKLPNKTHGKLGLGTKKARLKALANMN